MDEFQKEKIGFIIGLMVTLIAINPYLANVSSINFFTFLSLILKLKYFICLQ